MNNPSQILLHSLWLALFTVAFEANAFYDPNTGRWLSRDPIGERGAANLNGFVANNPIGDYDALGLRCCVKKMSTVHLYDYDRETTSHQLFKVEVEFYAPKGEGCRCDVKDCRFEQWAIGYLTINGVPKEMKSHQGTVVYKDRYVLDDAIDALANPFAYADGPGFEDANPKDAIEFYLMFQAKVIDKPSGSVVARKDGYWIKIDGKYKRQLDHGGFDKDEHPSPRVR